MHIQHFLPNVEVRESVGGRVSAFDSSGFRVLDGDCSTGRLSALLSGRSESIVWPEVQGCEDESWEDRQMQPGVLS